MIRPLPLVACLLLAPMTADSPAVPGVAAGRAAAASTAVRDDPDPRFLRVIRQPGPGASIRLDLASTASLVITIASPNAEDAPEVLTLEGSLRLDAVLRTVERDEAADRSVVEVRVIDGEVRIPGLERTRLPVGRRFLVTTVGRAASEVTPADDGDAPDEATAEALRTLLEVTGDASTGTKPDSGPPPVEGAAFGLGEPRSVGETWPLDPALVARLADLTVDDLPPASPVAAATATRQSPVVRGGRPVDRLVVRLTVDTSSDETVELLREVGARGAIDEGASETEFRLEVPREPGAVVLREEQRFRGSAAATGLAESPEARIDVAADATILRTAVREDDVDAAIERTRLARAEDQAAIARANARGVPWGLRFDLWAASPEWVARDPDSDAFIFEAERADGRIARVLRPDLLGVHGGTMTGLDESVRISGSARPGFEVGEAFDLVPEPPVRARYGVSPAGTRWFVWTFVDDRPVVVLLTEPADGPVTDRLTLAQLVAMVQASDAERAATMAAHPGVLSVGGARSSATPPSWLGARGADMAARGDGWRFIAWTIPLAIPEDGILVMLDAMAEATSFGLRPDVGELTIQDVRRMGRDGQAAVTPGARLEVLAGEADTIVILASHDRPSARPAMLAAIGRLVLEGPITAAMPPVDDGPIGEAARARTSAALISAFGTRLLQMELPQPALEAFQRALALSPDTVTLRLNRVAALAALGRRGEAMSLIDGDQALAELPVVQRLRARLSLESGDPEDARRRYEAFLTTFADGQAASNLVVALRDLEGAEPALARGTRWMDEHGPHPMVLLAMSIVAADAGDPARALQLVERAIALVPDDASLPPFREQYRAAIERDRGGQDDG